MASAATSSSYTASSGAASSNFLTTDSFKHSMVPKFGEYRSRVMLGDLPQDFLRIEVTQAQMYNPAGYNTRQAQNPTLMQQQLQQNPNFLGYFTLTIGEARLVKSSSLLGLVKVDPYVSFRIGHVSFDTATATGGGKNPQWKASYRINLFRGMDQVHIEVYDQRNFTEDNFLGECDIAIPPEVMNGETRQHWYPLMGRDASANENQGEILIIMSFVSARIANPRGATNPANTPAGLEGTANPSSSNTVPSAASSSLHMTEQHPRPPTEHSASAVPKSPPPMYSPEDVRTIEEMFPTVDRRVITDLLNEHRGNKDSVVNHLLQNSA